MQGIQEKISSGNKINRASDDPMGAVNLSAAKDQKTKIEQYVKNSDVAFMRLDLSDKTLDEMTSVLTRMTELSASAGNGIYDGFGHQAILQEMRNFTRWLWVLQTPLTVLAGLCLLAEARWLFHLQKRGWNDCL